MLRQVVAGKPKSLFHNFLQEIAKSKLSAMRRISSFFYSRTDAWPAEFAPAE